MALKPTGAVLSTDNVPLKSRSPSTSIRASCKSKPILVATAFKVTPAQAANASNSMSPEHTNVPSPPVAGCKPASDNALPVSTFQLIPSPALALAFSVISAAPGSSRYFAFKGSWTSLSSTAFIRCSFLNTPI